jgi:hypothetical protein
MQCFRKALVCVLVIGGGATAAAQDKGPATAVSLGQPTPLYQPGAQATGLTASESPSLALRAGQPRPTVARGAFPYLDDDQPKDPQPKAPLPLFPILPAPMEVKLPTAQPMKVVQPAEKDKPTVIEFEKPMLVERDKPKVVEKDKPKVIEKGKPKVIEVDKPKVIEVDKDGKVTVIPDPPRFQPLKAKAPTPPIVVKEPTTVLDERVIIVDDSGRPLWDGGFGAPPRFYAQSEYLRWWTRGMHLPPLVLTDSTATPLETRGILGNGTTQILFGNSDTSTGPTSGGRFTLGYALDPCGFCTLEGSFFFLGRKNDSAAFNSGNFPVLGRPFVDLNDGIINRELTTSPNQPGAVFAATGSIRVDTTSNLFGAEANLKSLLWCGCNYQITGLLGFRYLDLNESVRINESGVQQVAFADVDASIRPGDVASVFDNFNTHNRFYGGQIGASTEWNFGRWSLEGRVKLGLGVTQQVVDIDGGQTIVSRDGRVQPFRGGLYAVPSNIGSHAQNRFAFVPELGLKVNYQLTEHISLYAGYDFLYWSSVVRPGDQIDQVLDLNQVPNSGRPFPPANQVRPVVPFQVSSYWAQGVNAGVLFRY